MLSQLKKKSAGIIFLGILTLLFNSCGVRLIQEYDYGSGTNSLTTSVKKFSDNPNHERMMGWLEASNDTIFLALQIQFLRSDHQRFEVSPGQAVSVSFSDGTGLGLINSIDVISHRGVILGNMERIVNVYLPLSTDNMKSILSKDIVSIAVQVSAGNGRFAMTPANNQILRKMITLMRPDLVK
jgi:hypothetical protein